MATWGYEFYHSKIKFVIFTHFTSILQKLSRLSYNSYLHLSLFCRGNLILVSCFWFHQPYD